jgi:hypothetical protein
MSREDTDRVTELIEGGSELAGAAVGGALGLIGGPTGVLAGAAGGVFLTRTLKRVGTELRDRLLGPRQEVRVGAAFAFAANEIRERLEQGERERDDGWFEADASGRPKGEELLEGVLLNAANAYEERKVPYLGWLYASLAFDAGIGRDYANFLMRLADRLTFRQLASTAFFAPEPDPTLLVYVDTVRAGRSKRRSDPIMAELTELAQAGVIGVRQEDGSVVAPQGTYGGGDLRSLRFLDLALTSVGNDIYRLMRLDRIPRKDLIDVYEELGGDPALVTET